MEAFELRLGFSIMTWVCNYVPIGVSVEGLQTHIDADHAAGLNMFTLALGLDTELYIISICAAQDAYPLDLLHWEGFNVLLGIANQAQASDPTQVCEDDVASIGVYLPSGGFVLHTSVIVLKLGVALLAGFLVPAILVEAGDGEPGTISTGLTGLGIKACSKGVFLSEDSTIALEVIRGCTASVHPQTQALVADELHDTDSFIDSRVLLLVAVEFVLVDQHARFASRVFSVLLIMPQ